MSGLLILGAGGHGKVVAQTAALTGSWGRIAFADDNIPVGSEVCGFPVVVSVKSRIEVLPDYPDCIVAIGENSLRMELLEVVRHDGFGTPYLVHPDASVCSSARLGAGTVAFARVVVNADTVIGAGAILNTAATIDHDCHIGDGVHICPGVNVAGGVTVSSCAWLGIGSTLINNIKISEDAVVGAGAVVISDVNKGDTVIGVPARVKP